MMNIEYLFKILEIGKPGFFCVDEKNILNFEKKVYGKENKYSY